MEDSHIYHQTATDYATRRSEESRDFPIAREEEKDLLDLEAYQEEHKDDNYNN